MKSFFAKKNKIAIYVIVFLVAAAIVFAVIFRDNYEEPDVPSGFSEQHSAKEKSLKEVIRDLSVPVPISQNRENISEETVKSLSNPVPINKESSINNDEVKDAIKRLSKPVEINKK